MIERLARLPRPVLIGGALLAGGLLLAGILTINPREKGVLGSGKLPPVERLEREAREALRIIPTPENRSARRPMGFDDVLRPVDDLLRHAQNELDRQRLPEALRIGNLAAQLASEGLAQARQPTGNLRTQRFPDQIADAMRIVASAWLARLDADSAAGRAPPESILKPLEASLRTGLELRPTDRILLYLSASLDQKTGRWPSAEKSLKSAVDAYPDFAEAWNDLGVVRIMLRDNDGAEAAFLEAKRLAEPKDGSPPGATYHSAAGNLFDFHANLARHFRDAYVRSGDAAARQKAEDHRALASRAAADYRNGATPDESRRVREELARIGALEGGE